MLEELEEIAGWIRQRVPAPAGPHAGDQRNGIPLDEFVGETGDHVAIAGEIVVSGAGQEISSKAMEPADRGQEAKVRGRGQLAGPGEKATHATATRVLHSGPGIRDAHRHLGSRGSDPQLPKQLEQMRVGAVVVHDESGVNAKGLAASPGDCLCVRMSTEAILSLIDRDLVHPREQVGRGEARHP